MASYSHKNIVSSTDIAIINDALKQICTATLISLNSEEGQVLANMAITEYMSGERDQKKLVDMMLTRIRMADMIKSRAGRISRSL